MNPCAAIEPVRDKVTAGKATFTPKQVTALIKVADGDWPGLIRVAFYCGQRLGDCANLQWKQIDLAGEIKTIRFQQSKTGREVVTVIHPELEKILTSLRKQRKVVPLTSQSDEAYVFPSLAQQAGRNISPLSKAFRKLMARAGIRQHVIRERDQSGSGRRVNALSFHSCGMASFHVWPIVVFPKKSEWRWLVTLRAKWANGTRTASWLSIERPCRCSRVYKMNKRKRTVSAHDNPIIAAVRRSVPGTFALAVDPLPPQLLDPLIPFVFNDATIREIGVLVVKALLKGDQQIVGTLKDALTGTGTP